MRAIRVRQPGGPQALDLEEVDAPRPGPGEVLVRLGAAGVNFIDIYHRTGRYPLDTPFTPGMEGAGVVAEVGDDVDGFAVGDRVAYAMQVGSYAEQAVVPTRVLVRVPDSITTEQAAAVMLQGMTAHYLATSTTSLEDGDAVLVYAAAGGVGHLLTQAAKRRGARVLATASTTEKADLARADGADEVILYRDEDLVERVRELTDGRGVDVVYDSVGRDTFAASLDCLRPRGLLALYGQSSGAVEPLDPQVLNAKGSLFLTRPSLGHYIADAEELAWRADDLFGWIAAGELRVRVDRSFPLAEAAEAHRFLEAGRSAGKLLLDTTAA